MKFLLRFRKNRKNYYYNFLNKHANITQFIKNLILVNPWTINIFTRKTKENQRNFKFLELKNKNEILENTYERKN